MRSGGEVRGGAGQSGKFPSISDSADIIKKQASKLKRGDKKETIIFTNTTCMGGNGEGSLGRTTPTEI